MRNEYERGLKDAAAIADAFAVENFRLASDSILTDPVLSRYDVSPEGLALSEQCRTAGTIHSSMAHAAQNIAVFIRALGRIS